MGRIPRLGRPEKAAGLRVHQDDDGMRLDRFLKKRYARISRTKFQRYIVEGRVAIDGRVAKPHSPVKAGGTVEIDWPSVRGEEPDPGRIAFQILHEREDLLAVNKPPGLVVHPAGRHRTHTLMNALAARAPEVFEDPERAWRLLHRIDKNTSGLLLVAKGLAAKRLLAPLFEGRAVEKEYLALVEGAPPSPEGSIRLPIGRHRSEKGGMKMKIDREGGKPAETLYEVIERFRGFSLVLARPRTGRQHQIRIHLAAVGCPLVGDPLYGGRRELSAGDLGRPAEPAPLLARQALHCRRMGFVHPATRERLEFTAPLPPDMERALAALRAAR